MPKLKEISIQGFKSFADPLTLLFPTGITAIVGPNGSGKSNVADAIRWVLGEQRMRTLRGRTGEDMIFAGSKKRARSGRARVSLIFDNSDSWLPVDFAEVTIERRNYRDGSSDYLLNGSKVRLMDLRDLLDRAGLGRESYLTIGQGMVDRVLSLRPTERLALFEQAAGIAPYRRRREETLKRLEETHRNLERVQDIIGEIEPRLHRLERQVARAEQHAQLTADLQGLLRIWYGYRWGQVLHKLETTRQRVLYRQNKVQKQQESVDTLTARITELRQQLTKLRARLAELHRESSAQHAEAEGVQRELAVTRERRRLLQEQQEEGQANLAPLRMALEAEEDEAARLRGDLEAVAARLAGAQAQLETLEGEYRQIEERRHALLSRQSAAQAQALEHRHRLADRQSRLEQLSERATQLAGRTAQLTAALNSVTERRRTQQAAVEEARRAVEQRAAVQAALETEEERAQAAQETARGKSEQLRRDLAAKQADYQQLAARLGALERLHADGAGLYAGVRSVLRAANNGKLQGLPGTFAALVHVPPELERAIETALGGQLQNVVARRWEDARAAIAWLKRERAGRATFLPLDNLRPARPLELPEAQGLIGLAAELVTYDDPALRPAVRLLLGRVIVVQDLATARELHRQLRDRGGFQIVTLGGELLRSSGTLTGGRQRHERREGGLLARERERRTLPAQVESLQREVAALRETLQRSEEQAHSATQELRTLTEQRRHAERQQQEARRALEGAVRDLEQLLQEADWQRGLLAEAAEERARLEMTQSRLEDEQQKAAAQLAQAEATVAEVSQSLTELTDAGLDHEVSKQRTQVAVLTQERENHRILLETRERELQRLRERIAAQESRNLSLAEELQALELQVEKLQTQYATARAAADELAAQIPPLEQEVTALETEQGNFEEQGTELRRVLRNAEQRLVQAEIEARRREEQLRTLRREIKDALGIVVADLPENLSVQQPLPLSSTVSPLPTVMELPEGLEQQIRDLRTQIRRLGPVNTAAQEEYREVKERHTFLREQVADLETASAHLRKIITELDGLMETAFRTTFKAVATEFTRIFRLLFNGGIAKLKLLTSAGGEVVGVEITARPPGKRTSGLGMLSGGERTLTAVALLFAVMRISPTPFCVLDEVDAMLDEANVGRFRAFLQELGQQTQFIVITHNRHTVEAADTIYGVSMSEDGVSQVLSLNLEDLPVAEAA